MLVSFKVKNFLSFRDEVEISLNASKGTRLRDHIIETSDTKVVKTAGLFGAIPFFVET